MERALQSVGMAAFIDHFDIFAGPLDAGKAAAVLTKRMGWDIGGSRTRVNRARAIIAAGQTDRAFARVIAATRVSVETQQAARRLRSNSQI